ncbi:hypothetical protein EYY60_16465 [Flavobacterium zhairuonense]|uniref:hypothetical protein n=1 Tax=Flavobacterium zhairuonense TaxID=2493631 RepID=UPI00104C712D|nr:hypothetical protein [Flavobacterium zhairuonense]KAF2508714.1 hypothetical protein EYY60_16465 [Flavobacterium zhairuonense]
MKKFLLIISVFIVIGPSWGQESFKKKYFAPKQIQMKGGQTIILKKDTLTKYKDLSQIEQQALKDKYTGVKNISITKEEIVDGKKVTVTQNVDVNDDFYKSLTKNKTENAAVDFDKAFVKFTEDKVIVNPYLKMDENGNYKREGIYYYQLANRQAIRLNFTEWTVSAVTIPIKYRFKGKGGLQEEFSTAFNGNIIIGHSWGSTSFLYQDKVDNKSNTWKFTLSALFGASTVTLNSSNTSKALIPIEEDKEIIKGLGTLGAGGAFIYNKINIGVFYGYDYAIGSDASKWNYNKKPWLGLAIGYSLLNF